MMSRYIKMVRHNCIFCDKRKNKCKILDYDDIESKKPCSICKFFKTGKEFDADRVEYEIKKYSLSKMCGS